MEITREQLIKAMCTRAEPCGAHRDAAEKIWTRLEENDE